MMTEIGKLYLDSTMNAGGNYTFNLKFNECIYSLIYDALYNITFVDIYI